MLLPPLCTQQGYVDFATQAGLKVIGGPKDISQDVSKTWYVAQVCVRWEADIIQGYFVVSCAEPLALGLCVQPGEGRDCLLAVFPGDEERIRKRKLSLRSHGICQGVKICSWVVQVTTGRARRHGVGGRPLMNFITALLYTAFNRPHKERHVQPNAPSTQPKRLPMPGKYRVSHPTNPNQLVTSFIPKPPSQRKTTAPY